MKILISSSSKIPCKVICPTSKSYAARALIIASLRDGVFRLKQLSSARDTQELLSVLNQLGLKIRNMGDDTLIENSFPACEVQSDKLVELDCGEGGTTIRFLLPFLSLGKNTYHLRFSGRMLERPMDEIYKTLRALGVSIKPTSVGVELCGPIDLHKKATVDCLVSSQFASAFELLKAHFPGFDVEYKNLKLSKKYFELTKQMLQDFKGQDRYEIPVDFSAAGYFIAHAALSQDLCISNAKKLDELQADAIALELLSKCGLDYEFTNQGLIINKIVNFENGIHIDGELCIDLVPTLIFIASYLPFQSVFKNIEALRYKESDRLKWTLSLLDSFGAQYTYFESSGELLVEGATQRKPGVELDMPNDHRMVMLAALFLKYNGGGSVGPAQAVRKSFPDFFEFFGN